MVADLKFAGQVEQMLRGDLSGSKELSGYRLEAQSVWERFKASGSALLSPVL